jgi:hypothetical protein
VIRVVLVRENVNKELTRRFEKAVYLFQQVIVVFHVFKPIERDTI